MQMCPSIIHSALKPLAVTPTAGESDISRQKSVVAGHRSLYKYSI